MRIAVFEDNREYASRLTTLIEIWGKSKKMDISLCIFSSPYEASDLTMYDCLFLDVEMPGMNGIEFAHELRQNEIDIPIVFVSGYTEYSLDGYEVEALRFLDKNDQHFEKKLNECLDRLAYEISNSINAFYRITTERKLISISMREIAYFEVINHNLVIHTLSGIFTERKTLSQLKTELPNQFVQIGKSLIINVLQAAQVTKREVVFHDGKALPVSPKYSNDLFIAYSQMM